jgi:hypothetical protein
MGVEGKLKEVNMEAKQVSKIRRKQRMQRGKCMSGLGGRHCPNGPFYSCDQTQTDEIKKLSLIGTPTC